MNNFIYTYQNQLYLNLTNQCPCKCTFCLRKNFEGVGSANSLWLKEEPSAEQVIKGLKHYDLKKYDKITFCGYGEPFCKLDNMLEICKFLRKKEDIKISIDTNGLGELINGKSVINLFTGLIDSVSISLNSSNKNNYYKLCNPVFGLKSYDYVLKFINDCKQVVPKVILTVVDVIPSNEILACKKVAFRLKLPLKIRSFVT